MNRIAAVIPPLLLAALAGCSAVDRLQNVGEKPKLSAIENPVAAPGYRPVSMPMPSPVMAYYNPNSLWQSGSRTFFKDQRAQRVGDILTVIVSIADKAEIENTTKRSRANGDTLGGTGGLDGKILRLLPGVTDASAAVGVTSNMSSEGAGTVNRSEDLTTSIAAVVTQQLPNGNLVIEGRQEVRVNFEIRELIVAGVVRPEDIGAGNTIESSKIAQARISYGGRGQISDVQQPRYGQQVYDILLPF
jgi:flagellar L-ring protein precursor FlgH